MRPFSLFSFVGAAVAWSDPLPCSGTCTDTHDPSIIQRSTDGTYFRFATGGGLSIYSADSIQGPWDHSGEILPNGSSIDNPGADDAWAPDVHQLADGSYVCYYAVSSFGTQESAIGVATSDSLDAGTWTDHGSTGLQSTEGDTYNAIDANLLQAGSENVLTFGSFWGDIFQTAVSHDALSVVASQEPMNVEFNSTGTHPSEGAYLFQHSEYYYLFFSSGICCGYDSIMPAPGEEYKIMVCRSDSRTGPFVDADNVACTDGGGTLVLGSHGLVYGPGGQGVLGETDLGDVLYYHYVDTSIGYADGDKRLGVNVIDWSSGWPVV